MSRQMSLRCPYCRRHVLAALQSVPVGLHLLHTMLIFTTCGVWVIPYVLWMMKGTWRCQRCGRKI